VEDIKKLKTFILAVDQPIPQVELDVKLIEMSEKFGRDITAFQSSFGLGRIGRFTPDLSTTATDDLINSGFNLNEANKFGFTPLMAAALENDERIFDYLLKHNITASGTVSLPKDQNLDGAGLIHLAVMGNNPQIVKKVLKMSHNLNSSFGKNNQTALHHAVGNCSVEIADLLLESGANINAVNDSKRTPLHNSLVRQCYPVALMLLERGARIDIQDKEGKIALELLDRNNKDFAYYFEKKLGSGGYGAVYLAKHKKTGVKVAVKAMQKGRI
jgi:ankyrin repeat protein